MLDIMLDFIPNSLKDFDFVTSDVTFAILQQVTTIRCVAIVLDILVRNHTNVDIAPMPAYKPYR